VPAYSAYPTSNDAPENLRQAGALLREARKKAGFKQAYLAEQARTTVTTVSMVERGKRAVSPALLERLAAAVGADTAAVFRLFGTVPPGVASELLAPELGQPIDGGRLDADVRWEIRRLRLAELARAVTAELAEQPVDLPRLLHREFQLGCEEVPGLTWPRVGALAVEHGSGLDRTDLQRQLAHMAGHALLARVDGRRPDCHHGQAAEEEVEAEWLAGLIAMPRHLLRRRFQAALLGYRKRISEPPPGEAREDAVLRAAATDVAGQFSVRLWLALRHIADAGLLEWAAEE
jgi:transcriptional regulator with XRE-family HTH domain